MNEIFQQAFLTKPIAHRGLHDGNISIPENTIVALKKAMQKKYPIEIDIQIIKDDTIIVFHDTNLMRSSKMKIRTESLTYGKIKDISIFGTPYKIPTLKEVLELINGKVPILIDIKNYTRNKTLESKLLKILQDYKGEVALQSFNPFTVSWLKSQSDYATGFLVSKYNYLYFFDYFLMNKENAIDFVSIDKKLYNSKKYKHLSKKNIPILFWTLTSNEEKDILKKYYNNYIFESFCPL